jgi:peptide-methionine (S)-S-oxide reductase
VVLDVFCTLHDPRQLNHQGGGVASQDRSAMFYEDDEQRQEFEAASTRYGAAAFQVRSGLMVWR